MTAPAWTLTHDLHMFAIPTPHLAPVAPEQVAAEPTPLFVAAARAHLTTGTRAGLETWLPDAETLVERHTKSELQEMARRVPVSACGSKAEIAGRLVIA